MTKKSKNPTHQNYENIAGDTDIPATHGQLQSVRAELKSDIASLSLKVDSLDSKIDSLDSKIDSLDSRIDSLDSKIDSKFEKIISVVHNVQALVEEQNSRNKFVFDGLKSVLDVQTDLSARVDRLEKVTFGIGSN